MSHQHWVYYPFKAYSICKDVLFSLLTAEFVLSIFGGAGV
jgi:hypothetical protein